MNLFAWLFTGHLAGDFLLQTRWMAERKAQEWSPLVVHAALYTAVVALLGLLGGGLSPAGIAFLFLTHLILDRRTFVNWWSVLVSEHGASNAGDGTPEWLRIVLDQSFHVVALALATLM
jgi:hypothetical protein